MITSIRLTVTDHEGYEVSMCTTPIHVETSRIPLLMAMYEDMCRQIEIHKQKVSELNTQN